MKPGILISSILLIMTWPLFSQGNCEVPDPPVLTRVSVQPETNKVDVFWEPSPSVPIAGYIVYHYSEEVKGWIGDDTIWDQNARSHTYNATTKYSPQNMSVKLNVAAYRLPLTGKVGCPSRLPDSLSTIFLTQNFDSCQAKITLKWNKYFNTPKKVTGYKILISENNGPLAEKYSTGSESEQSVITDFVPDRQYSFVVKAELEGETQSFSNKVSLLTVMQKPPSWINTDYISVTENKDIELSYTIDPGSEIKKFALERGGSSFQQIAVLNTIGGKVKFTDKDARATDVNFYRLRALNSCNIPVLTSDTSSNINLTVTTLNEELLLKWNPFRIPDDSSNLYQVFIDTGNGFGPEANAGNFKEYKMNLKDLIYRNTSGDICFYVKVSAQNNPHGISGESISSRICISPGEGITVPNLFTPNNDLRNDLFRPILAFTPLKYHLVISDRNGRILFESSDFMEEWDGAGCDQGVYLWFLQVKAPSGKVIKRTGTITIVK
jgi:gliding motility-associated-like protein